MEWYLKVFKQYADFSGRARRTEFWMFVLFNTLVSSGLVILGVINIKLFGLLIIYVLVQIVPSLAVTVRRLHDIGKSGGYYFITFIPFGSFVLLYWLLKEGEKGVNNYGEDPKV